MWSLGDYVLLGVSAYIVGFVTRRIVDRIRRDW